MGLTRLTVARAGARRGLLAALVATVALVVAAIVLVIGSLTHAMRAIVMDALAAAETSERAAVLRIPVTDPAQFDLAADLLATRLGPAVIVTPPTRDLDVTAEWTLELDPARIDPWAIPVLADDLAFLDRDVRAVDGLAPQGASVAGGLGALLKSTVPSVLAVIAIAPVPVVLIVVAGVIAVLQLARLLAASRVLEQATLRARGLSRRQTWRASLAELTVVTAAGALVGTAVGVATATTSSGDVTAASAAEVIRTTWPVPALAIVVLAPLAARAASRFEATTGRAHRAATVTAAGVVTAAAAVFVWMLSQPSAGAWSFVVSAVAPALALGAAGLIVLAVFPLAAAAAARVAERRPGLAPALPARSVARTAAGFGVVVVLTALAAGGAVTSGAAGQTWADAQRRSAEFAAGADARADWGVPRVTPDDVVGVADSDAVDAAGAVVSQTARAGDTPLAIVALPPVPVTSPAIDSESLWDALPAEQVGAVLPDAATQIDARFDLRATGDPVLVGIDLDSEQPIFEPRTLPDLAALEASARVLDAHGTPASVPLALQYASRESPTSATVTASGTLPDGAAPWTLVGVSIGYPVSAGPDRLEVTPGTVTSSGSTLMPDATPQVIDRDVTTARVLFAPAINPLAGVVTAGLADRIGLSVGGTLTARFEGSSRSVDVEIARIVDAVPGVSDPFAIAVRLDALTQSLFFAGEPLDADQVWAVGPGARAAVDALGQRVVTGAASAGPIPALVAVWWVAAIAAALLAAIAIVSAALALARQRGVEVFALRALGVAPRRQASWRRAELAVVSAGGFVAGGLLGVLVAALTVPALTSTAVPAALPVFAEQFAVQPWPILAVGAILAAAVVTSDVFVGRTIAVQARAGRVREVS